MRSNQSPDAGVFFRVEFEFKTGLAGVRDLEISVDILCEVRRAALSLFSNKYIRLFM
jgi:hypothetical protein